MALTALEIKALSIRDKVYRVTDEKGLYLEIRPNGSKLWFLKYRAGGKESRLSLGAYPEVSLAEARSRRDDARKVVKAGGDPLLERKLEKAAKRAGSGNTFQLVAEDFIATKLVANGKAKSTIDKARWFLSHLTPAIGSRPIAEISPTEVLAALKRLERKGHRETAVRTCNFASRVFRFGVSTGRCAQDPASLLSDALAKPKVRHHAAILDPKLLGEFLRAIDGYQGGPIVHLAMQLAPHVFLRPGELRQGKWREVDWEAKIWTIPADRTKLRRDHAVPLSTQSLALLRELERHSGGYELMFPGQRSHLKPISENTLNATYRRLGFDKDTVSAHGLRATASTLLNESGKWHPDAIERALAHGHSDAVRGAYARGQHWDERVPMAQWWSDYLDKVRIGGEIVPFSDAQKA